MLSLTQMFFYASKIFWMLASPLTALWLLLFAAALIRLRWKRLGNRMIAIFATLFLFFGFFPVGANMMVWLETRYDRPAPMPQHVDGIIVLGGSFNSYLSEKTGYVSANGNIDRMLDFIILARQYPNAKHVFSGGSGHIQQPDRKEAADAEVFLKTAEFDTKQIIFERDSRNTFENVTFSKALLNPEKGEIWIVVTSAFHMPRTMAVFRQAEWDVVPYPSDPKTDGQYRLLSIPFGVSGNFFLLNKALHEWIGMIAYYVTGKSAFLWPQADVKSTP